MTISNQKKFFRHFGFFGLYIGVALCLLNRIMGLQNIKGTGLDFVYRWQAWETCPQACEKLISAEGAVKELKALNRRQKKGWLWAGIHRILLH